MAVVAPFRALRYDPSKVSDLSRVVTPPYDVINEEQQEQYYQADPHNIIRIELNRTRDTDNPEDNRYTRSAAHFQKWLAEGVLSRDQQPAFYLSETTYQDAEGQTRVRRGFFTLLRVEDFSSGVVLPHEKTFTGHKEDRLQLTKATGANISPIFALYPDDQNRVHQVLEGARRQPPLADFVDPMGLGQRLYAVDDPQACAQVQELMAGKVIFIADGHHRYETALNYRNYMRQKYPDNWQNMSFNYVLVYLCSMSDPGLTIFPCHRVLPHLDGFSAEDFLALAKPYFICQDIPIMGEGEAACQAFRAALAQAGRQGRSFGLAVADSDYFHVLTLRKGSLKESWWNQLEGPLRDLDVEVMTVVVLEHMLGLDNSARDHIHTIKYVSDMVEVVNEVRSGQARVGFLLNPTRIEQVKAVAEAGLIMPRKSTYFYPKVLTGLTINQVAPPEPIGS